MPQNKDIKSILNLVESVESRALQTCQEVLRLSEGLMECEENSPNKPPFSINYLEYYKSHEPVTSWIIRHIFAYSYEGHHPYFESFANTFLQRIGFRMEWIDSPVIDKDHEYKSIDILVRDKQYAVIIENKLKGADFQLNQLARYIATMRNEGYSDERIFVVILPKKDIDNDYLRGSVWNLPKDWQSTNDSRKCRVDPHNCWCDIPNYEPKAHCRECIPLRKLFEERTLFIHKELSNWLYECAENNIIGLPDEECSQQYVLRSAILQFVDFLNYLYNTRENDKFKMDVEKFLSDQLNLNDHDLFEQIALVEDKKNDAEKLVAELESLYWKKIEDFIADMFKRYHIHFERDCKLDEIPLFHCELSIDACPLIISLNKEGRYYCQIEIKGKNKKGISEIINNDFDILEELNDRENKKDCIWRYDNSYKETLLRFERVLGRLLEIQNKDKRNNIE